MVKFLGSKFSRIFLFFYFSFNAVLNQTHTKEEARHEHGAEAKVEKADIVSLQGGSSS